MLPVPPYVHPPSETEVNIANKVVENLVELAKGAPPANIISSDSLHKAMGIDLDAFGYSIPQTNASTGAEITGNQEPAPENQPVPMETDTGTATTVDESVEQVESALVGNEQVPNENIETGTEGHPDVFPDPTSEVMTT